LISRIAVSHEVAKQQVVLTQPSVNPGAVDRGRDQQLGLKLVSLVKLTVLIDDKNSIGKATNDDHQNEQEGSDVLECLFYDQHVEGCLLE
jgi:hypothetical protein